MKIVLGIHILSYGFVECTGLLFAKVSFWPQALVRGQLQWLFTRQVHLEVHALVGGGEDGRSTDGARKRNLNSKCWHSSGDSEIYVSGKQLVHIRWELDSLVIYVGVRIEKLVRCSLLNENRHWFHIYLIVTLGNLLEHYMFRCIEIRDLLLLAVLRPLDYGDFAMNKVSTSRSKLRKGGLFIGREQLRSAEMDSSACGICYRLYGP